MPVFFIPVVSLAFNTVKQLEWFFLAEEKEKKDFSLL